MVHSLTFLLVAFLSQKSDVMDFLSVLSATLESFELSYLEPLPWYRGINRDLLEDMCQKLSWQERAPENQPKMLVFVGCRGTLVDMSFDANDCLYFHGDNL